MRRKRILQGLEEHLSPLWRCSGNVQGVSGGCERSVTGERFAKSRGVKGRSIRLSKESTRPGDTSAMMYQKVVNKGFVVNTPVTDSELAVPPALSGCSFI